MQTYKHSNALVGWEQCIWLVSWLTCNYCCVFFKKKFLPKVHSLLRSSHWFSCQLPRQNTKCQALSLVWWLRTPSGSAVFFIQKLKLAVHELKHVSSSILCCLLEILNAVLLQNSMTGGITDYQQMFSLKTLFKRSRSICRFVSLMLIIRIHFSL